jgi:hypothetical protein
MCNWRRISKFRSSSAEPNPVSQNCEISYLPLPINLRKAAVSPIPHSLATRASPRSAASPKRSDRLCSVPVTPQDDRSPPLADADAEHLSLHLLPKPPFDRPHSISRALCRCGETCGHRQSRSFGLRSNVVLMFVTSPMVSETDLPLRNLYLISYNS